MPTEWGMINRDTENYPGIKINGEPDCKIILACYAERFIQICYKNQLGFEKWTIVNFDDEETVAYIEKYFGKRPGTERPSAGKTITLNELLQSLAKK